VFWAGRKAAFPRSPHLARLLLHGRHHPARQAAARPQAHPRIVEHYGLRFANVSMPATATCTHSSFMTPIRRVNWRRPRVRRRILKLCVEVGGVLTGRARRRRGKTRLDACDVHRDRLNQQQAAQMRLRRSGSAHPGKVFRNCTPLRRTRASPRACRQGAVPGHSEILNLTVKRVSRSWRSVFLAASIVLATTAGSAVAGRSRCGSSLRAR